ncbi:hypothetical protein JCM19231_4728 [Vibrio ishigakensis]|uniref:Outer membrane protein beta-barrel domain-containing protein n=1 Tax=Vibrio ishigakensis TaxID=1481914 RepID=A0A0B8P7N9_9VIBR|nr:hypothetical protein JCM19231_4728 [Vibrio ishigakensis]
MKALKYALLSTVAFASFANAGTVSDFFDGVSVGAGYINESGKDINVSGSSNRSDGFELYSQAPINDYLFVDSRYSWTQEDFSAQTKAGYQKTAELKRDHLQASVGAGYPYKVSDSVQLKPFVKTGWSWDKAKFDTTYLDSILMALKVTTASPLVQA